MSRPTTPPSRLRPTVDEGERAAIEQVLGPVPDAALLRAVRDGRGRDFQRLEFLGDSVLDLLLALHAVVEAGCPLCGGSGGRPEVSRLVTDRVLARQARDHDLGDWLEWEPSDERLADLVETSVAVAWLSRGWSGACDVAGELVHPLGPAVAGALVGEGPADAGSAAARRRLGAALLELAAADGLYRRLPGADEGELSQQRALLHRGARVAAWAESSGVVDPVGDPATVSNRVERSLADQLLAQGVDIALAQADAVLS